ncbi:NAD(P)-dependent oxidoreductase [Aestuariispira insulae]|uniref:3-hydroxyisobutyrate dehydrogenase-like beta-hydroxyacid dehydrogenase n=1 Tax=Aestuariispira insulae TaxID=1461337 RepID=A0A3D9HZL2_9PROT|nr:NAD(P)-dependent oxidoreductase [Aestuariispira insulae]RED54346.1 3-hydroxyisobutyrate dehydrogenase-like beta-hydroxyacid dehydrogenase [Aestuariispira insulae]
MSGQSLKGWKIGVIGLGLMGMPMARNLHQAGADVFVTSRSPGPAEKLADEGMTACESPAAMADAVETGGIILIMVTDTVACRTVLEGPEGLLTGNLDGKSVIDMGTTQVMDTRDLAAKVTDRGGYYLDAPVSGGQLGAEEATLSIMVGAAEEDFQKMLPMFQTLGSRVTRVGGIGAGQVAKSANQMIVGMTLDAVAEALSLAAAAGVDPAKVREALIGGFAGSRILDLHGQRMIDGAFDPGGRITVQRKDMVQAAALADAVGVDLPGLEKSREIWNSAVDAGLGELDQAGIFKLFRPRSQE